MSKMKYLVESGVLQNDTQSLVESHDTSSLMANMEWLGFPRKIGQKDWYERRKVNVNGKD